MMKREFGNKKLLIVDDLPPEDTAMVQALYARRAVSAEEHLRAIYNGRRDAISKALFDEEAVSRGRMQLVDGIHDILSGDHTSAKAGSFMSSFYVGYGHKSIGDCGTFTIFIEGVSTLAAKAFQDWGLYNGQETSTRAIDFSSSDDPKKIIGRLVDPIGTPASKLILDRWMSFYARSRPRVLAEVKRRYPRKSHEDEKTYEGAVSARTFDILRGFLPAGVTTQLSWHTNIRQAGDHLIGLTRHPLAEVREVAQVLAAMLYERYPSSGAAFGDLPSVSGIGAKTESTEAKEARWTWEKMAAEEYTYSAGAVATHFASTIHEVSLDHYRELTSTRPRGSKLPDFLTDLGQLTFSFDLDFGSFRDIQRQRHGVCRMPLLHTGNGFEQWYLDQLDDESRHEADSLIRVQGMSIEAEEEVGAVELQNYIAMGYKVDTVVTYGLPAAVYVMELRSGRHIHPTLRHVVHDNMIKPFLERYPGFTLHVDMEPDDWSIRRGGHVIEKR